MVKFGKILFIKKKVMVYLKNAIKYSITSLTISSRLDLDCKKRSYLSFSYLGIDRAGKEDVLKYNFRCKPSFHFFSV